MLDEICCDYEGKLILDKKQTVTVYIFKHLKQIYFLVINPQF